VSGGPVFLAPLRLEASAIRRGAPAATIERVGMGPARAAAACARLGTSIPAGRPVVLAGVAGGLVPGLCAGELVVASAIVGGDPEGAQLPLAAAPSMAAHLEAAGIPARLAPVYSSATILHGRAARVAAASSGAPVVEMEARWLSPLGASRPFAVLRVVLDTLEDELVSFASPRATVRALRVLRAAAAALASWAPADLSDPLTRSN